MQNKIDTINAKIHAACERSGRNASDVQLIAVSKKKPLSAIKEAIDCGLTVFGENYIQEAEQKIKELNTPSVSWHFIGHLQSNKSKFAVKLFDLIHTVDSLKLAKEINKQAKKIDKIQNILLQVNIGGESSKAGANPEDILDLARQISRLNNIRIKGLMTIPPPAETDEEAAFFFQQLRELSDTVTAEKIDNIAMTELSMGMTSDFETAIKEGATYIRVGTALFGERQ